MHSAMVTGMHTYVRREKSPEGRRHLSHKQLRKKSTAKKWCYEQHDRHT